MKYNSNNEKRLYKVWWHMKERCYNVKAYNYKNYGGRGIKICDEWKNDFNCFATWAYENGYDKNAKQGECTLDRIDNDGDYKPSNCRFVDNKIQQNNKTNNAVYIYNGEKHTLAEWSNITGIRYKTLERRINKYNYSFEEAVTKPVGESKYKVKLYTYNNETHTLLEWSEITGINYHTLKSRIRYLGDFYEAITTPIYFHKNNT